MDTLIAPLDSINVHAFLAPDNEFMGGSVTPGPRQPAMGGKGKIIMMKWVPSAIPARRAGPAASSRSLSSTRTSRCSTRRRADWDVTKAVSNTMSQRRT